MVSVECNKRVDTAVGIYLFVLYALLILFTNTILMLVFLYGVIVFFYLVEKEGKLTKDTMLNILSDPSFPSLLSRSALFLLLYMLLIFSPILIVVGLVVVFTGGVSSPIAPLLIFFSQFLNFGFFTYFIPKAVKASSIKEILEDYFWLITGMFVNEDKTVKQNVVVALICAIAYFVYPPLTVVISSLYFYYLFICGGKGVKN